VFFNFELDFSTGVIPRHILFRNASASQMQDSVRLSIKHDVVDTDIAYLFLSDSFQPPKIFGHFLLIISNPKGVKLVIYFC
jgi:hypothetical protein